MKTCLPLLSVLSFLISLVSCESNQKLPIKTEEQTTTTFCNPLDLSYRFMIDEPSRREAADPTVVKFKNHYFMFASKSGGYWTSQNLLQWNFIQTDQIPTEEYAPTAIGIGDVIYFLASSTEKSTLYKSTDPLSGEWSVAVEQLDSAVWDPAFFMDDDQKLYLYWGCSNQNPLYGVEVDYTQDFSFIGDVSVLKHVNANQFGWEVPGDYNTLVHQAPWIEGAWVNKHNGQYYLQYSGPGTEYKSYSDGVYVADQPLGPYSVQTHNPFAYKPEGFAAGAGHGSTFQDEFGNYWHVGTMTISQKHIFERRLGLFPTFIDSDGQMHSTTRFGDYPHRIPNKKIENQADIFPEWMLLSYKKTTTVSSQIDSLPPVNITNEDIRSYWAAKTGEPGEFASLDLGEVCNVKAVQINFAEHGATARGRMPEIKNRYTIEYSLDAQSWYMLDDQSNSNEDRSHVYLELAEAVHARYIKITNIEVPSGHFALSGLRVFGKGTGDEPEKVKTVQAQRLSDTRGVDIKWQQIANATGYNLLYGTDSTKLYHCYQVMEDTSVTIRSLHADLDYYFAIEAFNENGVSKLSEVTSAVH